MAANDIPPHVDQRLEQTAAAAGIARWHWRSWSHEPRAARLLIVDDEGAQMRALCDTLELEGYVDGGIYLRRTEALAALRPGEFDLLLTDLDDAGDGRHRTDQCRRGKSIPRSAPSS